MQTDNKSEWPAKLGCSTIAIIAIILAVCYGYSMVKKAYVMNSEDVVKQKQKDAYEMRELLSKDTDEAYAEGYDSGYFDGREEGYTQGYKEGYEEGEEEGYTQGHDEGYEEGYERGYEWALEERNIYD